MCKVQELLKDSRYKRIESIVEPFVMRKLEDYAPQKNKTHNSSKTIHDSIWGSIDYSNWEMQIIDSPLLQRLRDINQVGLASLTYPTARHSRFEHSLGVSSAAKKMCDRINSNSDYVISDDDRNSIILAALLHDVGHCFYSHLSESIYGEFEEFVELQKAFHSILERKPKPHEMLSFVIVNTNVFKDFFNQEIDYPSRKRYSEQLFSDIGQMIIGSNIERDNKIYSYQTAIINGPFDADKLDYIRRDGYTAGLTIEYDIERLFTKIQVHTLSTKDSKIEYRLVIDFNGITAIEELTFSKIMLFSYIYYHQKVLVSEVMVKDLVIGLCKLNVLKSMDDFLECTDSYIINLIKKADNLDPFPEYGKLDLFDLSKKIRNRDLPKRCFEISQTSIIPNEDSIGESEIALSKSFSEMQKKIIAGKYELSDYKDDVKVAAAQITRSKGVILDSLISDLRELTYSETLEKRQLFYSELVKEYEILHKDITFTMFDIYFVFPKLVSYGTTSDAIILGKDRKSLMTINDFVKLDDWACSFNSNKWRGYVFVSREIDRTIAYKVANKLILKGKAKLKNPSAYLKGILAD